MIFVNFAKKINIRMKHYYLFLAFGILFFACQNDSADNKPVKLDQKVTSVIQGTIVNPNYPNVIVESMGEQHTAAITNGQFTLNLLLDEPKIYNIRYGRRTGQLFINPGDSVKFSTTAREFSQVMNYSGDRSIENNYLTEKFNNDRTVKSLKVKTYKLEEQEFINAVEAEKLANQQKFEDFTKGKDIDPFFKFLMESEIYYEWANDRLIYPRYHQFYTKDQSFEVSPVYYDFQRGIDLNDPAKLYSPNFVSFISNYIDTKVAKLLEQEPDIQNRDAGVANSKFDIIQKSFSQKEIQEFLMYNTLKMHIKYEGANGTAALLETFDKVNNNLNFKRDIQKDYSVWKDLEAGKVAPTFAYQDIDGNMHDIADYKGKFIYVDIWATWCGPCKKELPYLEALQEEYKDNDKILFTSISIDKDRSAWERMVKDKDMKGLQLFAENEWRASIVRDYKIAGIPRFLLIDDEGKIISAHAPRPSSPKIKAQLKRLVEG